MVGASGDLDNILDLGDFGRDDEDSWLLAVVINSIVLGERTGWLTDLVAINPAPGEELAIGGACQRVVLTAGNVGNLVTAERLDNLGTHDVAAVDADRVLVAALGVVVETPADDTALGVNDEAVVRTAGKLDGLGAAGERTNAGRVEGSGVVALEETASKLGLLAGAPGVDLILLVEGEDVVETGSKLLDLGQLGDVGWGPLNANTTTEAQYTLVALEANVRTRSRRTESCCVLP